MDGGDGEVRGQYELLAWDELPPYVPPETKAQVHVGGRYWRMPPEDMAKLAEFPFDFDPCPYPRTFDGLTRDWGDWNFVNPPFRRADGDGAGPTAFVRKAIEQQKHGKSSVLVLPTQSYVNLLLEAGAELRSMGRIRWLEVETHEPMPGPSPITAFILRGNKKGGG